MSYIPFYYINFLKGDLFTPVGCEYSPPGRVVGTLEALRWQTGGDTGVYQE